MAEARYEDMEAGVKAALLVPGTPFRTVRDDVSNLGDPELVDELRSLSDANKSPAALVVYNGGDANGGLAGELVEDARLAVIVVAAKPTGSAASKGVYGLLRWVREKLHNQAIVGVQNPLRFRGNQRFRVMDQPTTVAAWMATFSADMRFPDGE